MSWPLYRAVTRGRPNSPKARGKSSTGNGLDGGAQRLDGHGVFVGERLAETLLARQLVRITDLQLVNPECAGAELLRHVYQLLVQPGDDGSDRDHRGRCR